VKIDLIGTPATE